MSKKELINQSLRKAAPDGRISCAIARKIAEKHRVPYSRIGKSANELRIKITSCELGCF